MSNNCKILRRTKKYNKMEIVCHRGASSQYAENTYNAIRMCAKYKSAGSEIDIQITKDKKIIVLHDTTLERTSKGTMPNIKLSQIEYNRIITYPTWKLNYEDIKKINIGSDNFPEHAPKLSKIINLIYKYLSFFLVVEIAGATSDKNSDFLILNPLKKLLQKKDKDKINLKDRIKIISFGPDILMLLNKDTFFRKFERYWVLEARDFDINKSRYNENVVKNPNGGINQNIVKKGIQGFIDRAKKKDLNLTGLDIESENTQSFARNVKIIKKAGLKVITWVFKHPIQAENDGNEYAKFQDNIGVNFFTTNIPNTILGIKNLC